MTPARHHWLRLAAGVVILLGSHALLRGYVTDDTYIHLRYAENLAARGEFAFNPGESTYGATSPLWILGLVLLAKLGIAGPPAGWALGLACGVLTLVVLAGLLRRLPFPEAWRWWLFLLAATDAWFLRWTASGMETPLATLVLLVLLWPVVMPSPVRGAPQSPGRLWPRYLAWGVAAGLAGLTRPEFLVLAPAALPGLLLCEYRQGDSLAGAAGRYRARPQGPALAAGLGWLATVGPWLAYAQLAFGRWTPGTATAKSNALTLAPGEVAGSLGRSLVQLGTTQGLLWLFFAVLVVVVLVERFQQEHAGDGDVDTLPETPWQFWQAVAIVLVVGTWTAVLLGGYALKGVWTISRYLSPLSPALLLSGAVLAYWLLNFTTEYRGRRALGRAVAAAVCGVTVAGNLALVALVVRPHAREFSAGVVACYLDKGAWIGEHSAPDDVIAAVDIGALAYGSQRRVLDLMGLVSPEIMALGRQYGFAPLVESGLWLRAGDRAGARAPTWFVDRTEGPPRWTGRTVRGVTFELVDTCVIHGVGLREQQDWTVATYRLRPAAGGG
ncbi:MAG TPA: hypothetical protein PLL30_11080 [Candidatus Krumholzibacteria bacterium]|nr:hypothetical protein [Candidatus Krumholzibacteria bacterium]HPD72308.1 hypothetical protein [Candidatus Krumholzibacteria bacterium]HRY40760.1 hypothetical protein [Candidatus Krumholzibacteria bacterium]